MDYAAMAQAIAGALGPLFPTPPPASNKKTTGYGPDQKDPESNRKGREIKDKSELRSTDLTATQPQREIGLEQVIDESTPSLRPLYGIAGGAEHIPHINEQMRSDIEFDLFNLVQPGYGEGSDNKMFLYQKAREDLIRYKQPMYFPNNWLGPSNYQHPLPWQWQNVKSVDDVKQSVDAMHARLQKVAALVERMGEETTAVLGRDVGEMPAALSSSGLRRDPRSPFEPTIQNRHNWTPILDPVGKDLDKKQGYKRLFSSLRDPDAVEVQTRNGGPHLNKRRSLEVILR
jgi:hypothetical protein